MNTRESAEMIVISGISSGLGICLARLLAEKGLRVRGFSRRIDRVKAILNHPQIELHSADLNCEETMGTICRGADFVIHLAALSSPWGSYSDFFHVNVNGTRSLVKAAAHSALKRFIHVSTPSIYFDYKDRLNISEDHELPKRCVNNYALTKKMAEGVIDEAAALGFPAITIRPRAIFGPHDQTLFPRILKACQTKGIPCFSKDSPMMDITYVDNVAHALWLAIEAPPSCLGQKYNITNGDPVSLWDILQKLMARLSIPIQMRRIPYPLAYGAASLFELMGRINGKEPVLTRYGVGVLKYSQTLSIEKARRELNYLPIVSINEGIDRYVRWLQTY